jgi:septal ring factor EnvC (AmiA/AmiB activator)
MQLREMRFAKIEGLEVLVEVHSAAEAKSAIRELKHKKKELALLKRRLLKEQAAARRAEAREERERERQARQRGVVATLRRVSRVFRSKAPERDLEAIGRDVDRTDEILHNIDSCIIQLEGKLLV